jgi:hypothetical protein
VLPEAENWLRAMGAVVIWTVVPVNRAVLGSL